MSGPGGIQSRVHRAERPAFTALSARKVGSPWRYAFAPSLLVGIMVAVQIIGDYGDLGMGAAYEAAAARAPY